MPYRLSLRSYMAMAKAGFDVPASQRPGHPLLFVVGNESADLDSLCSTIMLAYFRTIRFPQQLHVPLFNLYRSDLILRPEMTAILRRIAIEPSDIVTLSDLTAFNGQETNWILVDHNRISAQLKQYSNRVYGCIDHHQDEHAVPNDAALRIIETCGSCMSLVVAENRDTWESMLWNRENQHAAEDENLAILGLAPILVDTSNFTAVDQVKPIDEAALAFLESRILDSSYQRGEFYQEMLHMKEDISLLNLRDIFRKDYKEWQEGEAILGVSTINQNLDYLLQKAGDKRVFLNEFAAWASERALDIATIMTTSRAIGSFRRELVVWGMNELGEKALQRFVKVSRNLRLEQWGTGELDEGEIRKAWRQNEVTASRKQVAPMLREALNLERKIADRFASVEKSAVMGPRKKCKFTFIMVKGTRKTKNHDLTVQCTIDDPNIG